MAETNAWFIYIYVQNTKVQLWKDKNSSSRINPLKFFSKFVFDTHNSLFLFDTDVEKCWTRFWYRNCVYSDAYNGVAINIKGRNISNSLEITASLLSFVQMLYCYHITAFELLLSEYLTFCLLSICPTFFICYLSLQNYWYKVMLLVEITSGVAWLLHKCYRSSN